VGGTVVEVVVVGGTVVEVVVVGGTVVEVVVVGGTVVDVMVVGGTVVDVVVVDLFIRIGPVRELVQLLASARRLTTVAGKTLTVVFIPSAGPACIRPFEAATDTRPLRGESALGDVSATGAPEASVAAANGETTIVATTMAAMPTVKIPAESFTRLVNPVSLALVGRYSDISRMYGISARLTNGLST
jgi:hypothetical protein